MKTIHWAVIWARVVALAGIFTSSGAALGYLPASWQHPAAAVAGLLIAVQSVLPGVQNSHTSTQG